MFDALKRRERKASPVPGDRTTNNGSAATNDDKRLRRRAAETELPSGTLLPSSFYPSPTPLKRTVSRNLPVYTSPGTSTCNTFLLGGQYYPGKDKKRRNLRKKTLWHRIFCSSPGRMVFSAVLFSYLLVWYVLVPVTETLLDYGRILSGGAAKRLFLSSSFTLPSLEDQKRHFQHLNEARLRFRRQQKQTAELKLLEKIAPEWFHRNDASPLDEDQHQHTGKHHQRDSASKDKVHAGSKSDKDDASSRNQQPQRAEESIPKAVVEGESIQENEFDPTKGFVKETLNSVGDSKNISASVSEIPVSTLVDEHAAKLVIEKQATEPHTESDPAVDTTTTSNTTKAQPIITLVEEQHTKVKIENPIELVDPSVLRLKGTHTTIGDSAPSITTEAVIPVPKQEVGERIFAMNDTTPYNTTVPEASILEAAENLPKQTTKSVERTLINMDDVPNQSTCPFNLSPNDVKTTLLIQCSLDRMWILKETCSRWKDPIVVVVYVSVLEVPSTSEEWHAFCPQMTVISYMAKDDDPAWGYPVNRLRNLGLDAIKTSHVLVVDVDFVPSMSLDEKIHENLQLRNQQRVVVDGMIDEDRDAIVVPAFERVLNKPCTTANSTFIPRTLSDLMICVEDENCTVFQISNNWEGHHSTRTESWLKGDFYGPEIHLPDNSTTRLIKDVECFDSMRYEPYVVIRWCPSGEHADAPKPVAPYYDERFYGYGKNKIEMVSHLRFMGYKFSILPEGFIVHNPHVESVAKKAWNNVRDFKLHENMDGLYPQFLHDLARKYAEQAKSMVKQCEHKPKKDDNNEEKSREEATERPRKEVKLAETAILAGETGENNDPSQ
jgi:hypothetical protein